LGTAEPILVILQSVAGVSGFVDLIPFQSAKAKVAYTALKLPDMQMHSSPIREDLVSMSS
jgi:hypothetical protein